MEWLVHTGDILEEPADVLICSANGYLNLSGGVGGEILRRCGDAMQKELHAHLAEKGIRCVKPGELVTTGGCGTRFRAVIHAVAIDVFYQASVEQVRQTVWDALERAAALDARSVALTALATGYGRMSMSAFAEAIADMEAFRSIPAIELRELSFPAADDPHEPFTLVTNQGTGYVDAETGTLLVWQDLSFLEKLSETIYMLHTGQGAAILGLLLESPMHGYELRKRLTGLLGAFRAFSYGSLYPALRRMQADGLIVEDAAPDGTPKMRRARRVYQLSDTGKARFAELVADTGPQNYTDDGFGVHLAFFNRTPAEARMRILEGRRRQVEERREGLREAVARASTSLDRYTRQLHQLGLESSEREVRWLNELIAAERVAQGNPETQP